MSLSRMWRGVPFILLALGFVSCGEKTKSVFTPEPEVLQDARIIAMVLEGSIRPPEGLAGIVARELTTIRGEFGEMDGRIAGIHVRTPWDPNAVLIGMTDEAAASVEAGTYTDWNQLNADEGAQVAEVHRFSGSAWVILRFDDLINARLMAERYTGFSGVKYSLPDLYGGDSPNLYPNVLDGRRTYLFREAGGDCPAGCTTSEFWYFRMMDGAPTYVGHWDAKAPQPDWWPEAYQGIENFRDW